jgi:hypothetical protein
MWKNHWPTLLLTASAVASCPVWSQDADTLADIRCVAVGVRSAEKPDSQQKSTGTLLVLYYIGRLDGRNPTLDVEKLLSEQIGKMTDADYAAEGIRCSRDLTKKGAQITRIGEDMQKHFSR